MQNDLLLNNVRCFSMTLFVMNAMLHEQPWRCHSLNFPDRFFRDFSTHRRFRRACAASSWFFYTKAPELIILSLFIVLILGIFQTSLAKVNDFEYKFQEYF